jgi:DUF4097 and DUF4098 domain-containing protein YvlB
MNKLIRFGLAFLLIGLALVLVVSTTTNANIFVLDDENFTLNEEDYSKDDFDSFYFDLDNRSVYIEESEDDQIHLKYYTHEKDLVDYEDTENEVNLTITRKWYYNIFSFNVFSDKDYYKVYLSLPADLVIDMLEVSTSNGRVESDVDNVFSTVRLISSNGRMDIANLSANNILVSTSNGDIDLNDVVVSSSVDLDTSNGDILINNLAANEIDADTSNGRVYLLVLGEKEDYRVTLSTSNGSEIYDGLKVDSGTINSSGSKTISLDSSNGDVEVSFTD